MEKLRPRPPVTRGHVLAATMALSGLLRVGHAQDTGAVDTKVPTALATASSAWITRDAKVDLDAFDALRKTVLLANGQRLAYVDTGDPTGQPVVFIHAYTDNLRTWTPMLPYVSRGFRLVLIDLRGHGQSAKPECCYSRFDFAYDIKLLLDALNITQADLVGHSIGSVVAQTVAEQWPQRTRRVVLISSTGGPLPGEPVKDATAGFAASIRKLTDPIGAESPFMIGWWTAAKPADPEFFRRQRHDAAGIPLSVWLAVLDQGWGFNDLQSTLPKLKAPALLIWGNEDFLMTEVDRRSLRNALPAAQVQILLGLTHNPYWDDPARVAEAINQFLTAK